MALQGFTNGEQRVATEDDCKARWGLTAKPSNFRCYMCGHGFQVGDKWRWQYGCGRTFNHEGKVFGLTNFIVCDKCDGPDVLDRWVAIHEDFYSPRFWALR